MRPHDEHSRNPAGRIYSFLEYCNTHYEGGTLQSTLPSYLEIDSTSTSDLYLGAAELLQQPAKMRRAIESLTVQPQVPVASLLEDIPRIETAFATGSPGHRPRLQRLRYGRTRVWVKPHSSRWSVTSESNFGTYALTDTVNKVGE
jgi:hypothetical protein